MTLYYATTLTPVGELLFVTGPCGLLRVAFDREHHGTVLIDLTSRTRQPPIFDPDRLTDALDQTRDYFAGERTDFDLELDLSLSSPFRREVQSALADIPYGDTSSYAELAERVGRPRAVRAVGTACSTNPLPVVLPCHRVVRSDGSVGNYLGGKDAKMTMLNLELRHHLIGA